MRLLRYFEAIQGQAKGELFGVANLFAVRISSSSSQTPSVRCLTTEIFRRQEHVEEIVRGRRRAQVMDNMLDYDAGQEGEVDSAKSADVEDPMGLADIVLDEVYRCSIKAVQVCSNCCSITHLLYGIRRILTSRTRRPPLPERRARRSSNATRRSIVMNRVGSRMY